MIFIFMIIQAICGFCLVKATKKSTYLAVGSGAACAIPVLGIVFIFGLFLHLDPFEMM
jgi:hypothetical protein